MFVNKNKSSPFGNLVSEYIFKLKFMYKKRSDEIRRKLTVETRWARPYHVDGHEYHQRDRTRPCVD